MYVILIDSDKSWPVRNYMCFFCVDFLMIYIFITNYIDLKLINTNFHLTLLIIITSFANIIINHIKKINLLYSTIRYLITSYVQVVPRT